MDAFPSNIVRIGDKGFELLGAPIGAPEYCNEYVEKRVAKIKRALANLNLIDDPQVEMALLRSCMGFPRMTFALRSAPPTYIDSAVAAYDSRHSSEQVCPVLDGASGGASLFADQVWRATTDEGKGHIWGTSFRHEALWALYWAARS